MVERRTIFAFFLILLLLAGCGKAFSKTGGVSSSSLTLGAQEQEVRVGNADLQKVQQLMHNMTVQEKIGQLLIVEYYGSAYSGSDLQKMIKQQYISGFLYQPNNGNFDAPTNTPQAVAAFSKKAVGDAKTPLLIGTDQEGGTVSRLSTFYGDLPSAQSMGGSGEPDMAYQQGKQAGVWMNDMGINMDLAPVADVQTVNPPPAGLATRMFGHDPKTVATYAGRYLDGLQKQHIVSALKHFPGLGAVTSDPHFSLPVVKRSKADLEKIDLAPYKQLLVKNNPSMVMATDVLVPALDPKLPAELSPSIIQKVLRGEMGYQGVVISDDLHMEGISKQWSLGEATVLALIAGVDLIEDPITNEQVDGIMQTVQKALKGGRLSQGRLDEAVQRVLLMKLHYGLIK